MLLLQCATPESVIRLRKTKLRHEEQRLIDWYFRKQRHNSLEEFLFHELCEREPQKPDVNLFIQVIINNLYYMSNAFQCDKGNVSYNSN